MSKDLKGNKALHIKPDDIVPLANLTSPEADLLKRILQQMVENERRRVRNEFFRLMLLFFVIFLSAIGAACWFGRGLIAEIAAGTAAVRSDLSISPESSSDARQSSQISVPPLPDPSKATTQAAVETESAVSALPRPEPAAADQSNENSSKASAVQKLWGNTLVVPIKGNIPLRAPIPKP